MYCIYKIWVGLNYFCFICLSNASACLPCLTVLSSWSFISLPFCCTLQISVEINKKKTLIVDYINKNIFVLSLTFNLFCYKLYEPSVFSVSGRPSTRHAFVLFWTCFRSERMVLCVVSKCSLNKFGFALRVPCCL